MLRITLGNQFINYSFEEGRLHEALGNGLGAFLNISSPLSGEWGIRSALSNYLERGTKKLRIRENKTQYHQHISFKKKGGDVLITSHIEDWCCTNVVQRRVGKPVTVTVPLSEIIEYVERK